MTVLARRRCGALYCVADKARPAADLRGWGGGRGGGKGEAASSLSSSIWEVIFQARSPISPCRGNPARGEVLFHNHAFLKDCQATARGNNDVYEAAERLTDESDDLGGGRRAMGGAVSQRN